MKIEKRYIVGSLMLIPFLPLVLMGFLAFWLALYAIAGYQIGRVVYDWIEDKVGNK